MPNATVQYHNFSRSMYRARQVNLPKNAIDAESVHTAFLNEDIFKKYGKTADGKSFFKSAVNIDGQFAYVIFMSDDICRLISDAIPVQQRKYLMDATFQICPYGVFNQLLIIYISYLDQVCLSCFFYCEMMHLFEYVFYSR